MAKMCSPTIKFSKHGDVFINHILNHNLCCYLKNRNDIFHEIEQPYYMCFYGTSVTVTDKATVN